MHSNRKPCSTADQFVHLASAKGLEEYAMPLNSLPPPRLQVFTVRGPCRPSPRPYTHEIFLSLSQHQNTSRFAPPAHGPTKDSFVLERQSLPACASAPYLRQKASGNVRRVSGAEQHTSSNKLLALVSTVHGPAAFPAVPPSNSPPPRLLLSPSLPSSPRAWPPLARPSYLHIILPVPPALPPPHLRPSFP